MAHEPVGNGNDTANGQGTAKLYRETNLTDTAAGTVVRADALNMFTRELINAIVALGGIIKLTPEADRQANWNQLATGLQTMQSRITAILLAKNDSINLDNSSNFASSKAVHDVGDLRNIQLNAYSWSNQGTHNQISGAQQGQFNQPPRVGLFSYQSNNSLPTGNRDKGMLIVEDAMAGSAFGTSRQTCVVDSTKRIFYRVSDTTWDAGGGVQVPSFSGDWLEVLTEGSIDDVISNKIYNAESIITSFNGLFSAGLYEYFGIASGHPAGSGSNRGTCKVEIAKVHSTDIGGAKQTVSDSGSGKIFYRTTEVVNLNNQANFTNATWHELVVDSVEELPNLKTAPMLQGRVVYAGTYKRTTVVNLNNLSTSFTAGFAAGLGYSSKIIYKDTTLGLMLQPFLAVVGTGSDLGKITITHSLGHTRYTANITPLNNNNADRTVILAEKNDNTLVIHFTGNSQTSSAVFDFDLVINAYNVIGT